MHWTGIAADPPASVCVLQTIKHTWKFSFSSITTVESGAKVRIALGSGQPMLPARPPDVAVVTNPVPDVMMRQGTRCIAVEEPPTRISRYDRFRTVPQSTPFEPRSAT